MRIFNHISDTTACTYYRTILPARHLTEALAATGTEVVTTAKLAAPDDPYDAYYFKRIVAPVAYPAIRKLKDRGAIIIWDLDDDFWNIPEWSQCHRPVVQGGFLEWLNIYLKMADVITCTNATLASRVVAETDATAPIFIVPNLIDWNDYAPATEEHIYKKYTNMRTRPRVLWAGTATHGGDLEACAGMVERVTGAQFVFVGERMTGALNLAQVDIDEYPKFVGFLDADVNLLPLQDNPFNKSKSPIKYFETATAGLVQVTYAGTVYAETAPHVIHVVASPDEMEDRVRAIVGGGVPRDELINTALLGQDHVKNEHSWSSTSQTQKWLTMFSYVQGLAERGPRPTPHPRLHLQTL